MKTIKKVAVTPVATNGGQIVDSTSSSDDKHTNTYSMNAIDELVGNVGITSSSTSLTGIKSTDESVSLSFYFYKYGKVVTCYVSATILAGAFGFKTFSDNPTFPEGYRPQRPLTDFGYSEIGSYSTDSGGNPTEVNSCEITLKYFFTTINQITVYNKDKLNNHTLNFFVTYLTD